MYSLQSIEKNQYMYCQITGPPPLILTLRLFDSPFKRNSFIYLQLARVDFIAVNISFSQMLLKRIKPCQTSFWKTMYRYVIETEVNIFQCCNLHSCRIKFEESFLRQYMYM